MAFVQPLDLALILQSAQNFTANKMKREDRDFQQQQYAHKIEVARKEQEAMVKLKQAQAKVLQAKPEFRGEAMAELEGVDPETAMSTRKSLQDLEDADRKAASAAQLNTAKAMKQSLEAYAANPDPATLNREVMRLGTLSKAGTINMDPQTMLQFKASPPAPGSPRFQETMRGLDDTISMLGEPVKQEFYGGNQFKEIATNLASTLAGQGAPDPRVMRDPDYAQTQYPELFAEETKKWNAERATSARAKGTTIINKIPGKTMDPVTMGARTAFQKDTLAGMAILSNLRAIDINQAGEFQTIQAGAKAAGARALDAFGMLEKVAGSKGTEFLGARRVFKEKVGRVFNQYRREITGAQAAFVELVRLKESMLNPDLGPTEMKDSYKAFVAEVERIDRLRRRVLREGFDVTDPNAFGAAVDNAYERDTGVDYEQDVAPVIQELRQRDPEITDEEIKERLSDLGL